MRLSQGQPGESEFDRGILVTSMRRVIVIASVGLFWTAVYLALDFSYTIFFVAKERAARVPNPLYHHGLAPNFRGTDSWATLQHRLFTNSLGFMDATVREVPARSEFHRVVLIGDSFTEGVGLPFEDTFAGMLFSAGQNSSAQIEFLNAAVISYSPVIYYKKIRALFEQGLKFDEVIVFSDLTDVRDEASSYFCIDDDPRYARYCPFWDRPVINQLGTYLKHRFSLTHTLLGLVKSMLRIARLSVSAYAGEPRHAEGTWPFAANYEPLGIEGGIERSLKNMGRLSAFLQNHQIALTIVVYPHPTQLASRDNNTRQAAMWREFCAGRCKAFIDLFPAFIAEAEANQDWQRRLFIPSDAHYNREGNAVMFRELSKSLLPPAAGPRHLPAPGNERANSGGR